MTFRSRILSTLLLLSLATIPAGIRTAHAENPDAPQVTGEASEDCNDPNHTSGTKVACNVGNFESAAAAQAAKMPGRISAFIKAMGEDAKIVYKWSEAHPIKVPAKFLKQPEKFPAPGPLKDPTIKMQCDGLEGDERMRKIDQNMAAMKGSFDKMEAALVNFEKVGCPVANSTDKIDQDKYKLAYDQSQVAIEAWETAIEPIMYHGPNVAVDINNQIRAGKFPEDAGRCSQMIRMLVSMNRDFRKSAYQKFTCKKTAKRNFASQWAIEDWKMFLNSFEEGIHKK
jgi:hypothetical protein